MPPGPAEPERRRRERQPQQQFNVASGKPEGGSVPESSQHPAWRAIVANLAAGATAGCAVEAGEGWEVSRHKANLGEVFLTQLSVPKRSMLEWSGLPVPHAVGYPNCENLWSQLCILSTL